MDFCMAVCACVPFIDFISNETKNNNTIKVLRGWRILQLVRMIRTIWIINVRISKEDHFESITSAVASALAWANCCCCCLFFFFFLKNSLRFSFKLSTIHRFYAAIKILCLPSIRSVRRPHRFRHALETSPQSHFMRLADGILNDN